MTTIQICKKADKAVYSKFISQMFILDIMLNGGKDLHKTEKEYINYLFEGNPYLIIMTKNCNLIGYILISPNRTRTQTRISNFIISNDSRGKGYGKRLFKVAINFIKSTFPKVKEIYLKVSSSNEIAKSMYENNGFKTVFETMKLDLKKG